MVKFSDSNKRHATTAPATKQQELQCMASGVRCPSEWSLQQLHTHAANDHAHACEMGNRLANYINGTQAQD